MRNKCLAALGGLIVGSALTWFLVARPGQPSSVKFLADLKVESTTQYLAADGSTVIRRRFKIGDQHLAELLGLIREDESQQRLVVKPRRTEIVLNDILKYRYEQCEFEFLGPRLSSSGEIESSLVLVERKPVGLGKRVLSWFGFG